MATNRDFKEQNDSTFTSKRAARDLSTDQDKRNRKARRIIEVKKLCRELGVTPEEMGIKPSDLVVA